MPTKNKTKNKAAISNKPRNFVAKHAHMHRGGEHRVSKSGERRKQKNKLKKQIGRLAQQGDFFMWSENNFIMVPSSM